VLQGRIVADELDLSELVGALKRMREVDRRLQNLQTRRGLSMRGFLLANGPGRMPGKPAAEQDIGRHGSAPAGPGIVSG